MRTVWKFTLHPDQPVKMPVGAQALYVAEQHGDLCLWALVDDTAELAPREFLIVGTGHDAGAAGSYIGSALMMGGMLVSHVFEPQS